MRRNGTTRSNGRSPRRYALRTASASGARKNASTRRPSADTTIGPRSTRNAPRHQVHACRTCATASAAAAVSRRHSASTSTRPARASLPVTVVVVPGTVDSHVAGRESRTERCRARGLQVLCLDAADEPLAFAIDQAVAPSGVVRVGADSQPLQQRAFRCRCQRRRERLLEVEIRHATPPRSARRESRRQPGSAAQERGEMFAEVAGVVFGAMDEARFAPAHEVETQHVQAWRVDDAAVVTQASLAIEHGHLQPVKVGTKARGPDDRADATPGQVERQRRLRVDARRCESLRRVRDDDRSPTAGCSGCSASQRSMRVRASARA